MPSSFNRVSLRQPVLDQPLDGKVPTSAVASGLDCALNRAAEHEPRRLPLRVALPLIAGLSLAVWAGAWLLFRIFIFG